MRCHGAHPRRTAYRTLRSHVNYADDPLIATSDETFASEGRASLDDARAASGAVVCVAPAARSEHGLEGDEAIHAIRLIRIAPQGFAPLEAVGGRSTLDLRQNGKAAHQ
jgi:hypothetical protein